MKKSKQVIIMRKDLNMRKGKMISQGAHASMKVILDMMDSEPNECTQSSEGNVILSLSLDNQTPLFDWIEGIFTKICVSVNSEDELLGLYNSAKAAGLPCSLILDAGLTEFDKPTYTCVAIGPAWSEDIDPFTKNLSLL